MANTIMMANNKSIAYRIGLMHGVHILDKIIATYLLMITNQYTWKIHYDISHFPHIGCSPNLVVVCTCLAAIYAGVF